MIRNNTGTVKTSLNQDEADENNTQKEDIDLTEKIKPEFLLIPNPSDGNFVVKLLSSASGVVYIIDMHGKIIKEVNVTKDGEFRIEKGTLKPSVYNIRLLNGDESYQLNKRIIILD
jgi:hypothetical protein